MKIYSHLLDHNTGTPSTGSSLHSICLYIVINVLYNISCFFVKCGESGEVSWFLFYLIQLRHFQY